MTLWCGEGEVVRGEGGEEILESGGKVGGGAWGGRGGRWEGRRGGEEDR